jgi:serine/threonine protein kinase
MAPEQLRAEELTTAIDAWALGLAMWEMMTERKPWDNRYADFESLSAAVLGGERVPLPERPGPFPQIYCDLIAQSGRDSVRPGPASARAQARSRAQVCRRFCAAGRHGLRCGASYTAHGQFMLSPPPLSTIDTCLHCDSRRIGRRYRECGTAWRWGCRPCG